MTNDNLRVGLYARVSGEQQEKEDTIASQLEAVTQRVASDGFRALGRVDLGGCPPRSPTDPALWELQGVIPGATRPAETPDDRL